MSNAIKTNLPAGIDSSNFAFESPIKNLILVKKGTSLASVTAAKVKANWTTLIGSLAAYVPTGLASYSDTGDKLKINTTAFGKKFVVMDGIPSMQAMLEVASGDHLELMNALSNGLYGVYFVLMNGNIKGWVDGNGAFQPFTARVHATTAGAQVLDKPEDFYPLDILFQDYEEFKASVIADLAWNADRELVAAMPFGLSMIPTAAYNTTSGVQSVQITSRGVDGDSLGYAGLVAADFAVISSNVAVPAITAVTDNGNGLYDLTVNKAATPVALAAGDYVIVQVKKGTPVTAVSNELQVTA